MCWWRSTPNSTSERFWLTLAFSVALAAQARTLADDLFKQKHPDAVIEHGDLMLATSNVG